VPFPLLRLLCLGHYKLTPKELVEGFELVRDRLGFLEEETADASLTKSVALDCVVRDSWPLGSTQCMCRVHEPFVSRVLQIGADDLVQIPFSGEFAEQNVFDDLLKGRAHFLAKYRKLLRRIDDAVNEIRLSVIHLLSHRVDPFDVSAIGSVELLQCVVSFVKSNAWPDKASQIPSSTWNTIASADFLYGALQRVSASRLRTLLLLLTESLGNATGDPRVWKAIVSTHRMLQLASADLDRHPHELHSLYHRMVRSVIEPPECAPWTRHAQWQGVPLFPHADHSDAFPFDLQKPLILAPWRAITTSCIPTKIRLYDNGCMLVVGGATGSIEVIRLDHEEHHVIPSVTPAGHAVTTVRMLPRDTLQPSHILIVGADADDVTAWDVMGAAPKALAIARPPLVQNTVDYAKHRQARLFGQLNSTASDGSVASSFRDFLLLFVASPDPQNPDEPSPMHDACSPSEFNLRMVSTNAAVVHGCAVLSLGSGLLFPGTLTADTDGSRPVAAALLEGGDGNTIVAIGYAHGTGGCGVLLFHLLERVLVDES
jgi:hypothetical protein